MDFYGFGNQQKRLCACGGGKGELMGNSAGVLIVICLTNNSELFWGEITSCTNINMPGRSLLCLEELYSRGSLNEDLMFLAVHAGRRCGVYGRARGQVPKLPVSGHRWRSARVVKNPQRPYVANHQSLAP